MKELYYVEFVLRYGEGNYPYVMQSKWFDTKIKAKNWVKKSFDFIDKAEIEIYIMSAPVDEDGELDGDIEQVEKITF